MHSRAFLKYDWKNTNTIILKELVNGNEDLKLETTKYKEKRIASIKDFQRVHTAEEIENNRLHFLPGRTIKRKKRFILGNAHTKNRTIQEFRLKNNRKHKKTATRFNEIAMQHGYNVANQAMLLNKLNYTGEIEDQKVQKNTTTKKIKKQII